MKKRTSKDDFIEIWSIWFDCVYAIFERLGYVLFVPFIWPLALMIRRYNRRRR